MGYHGISLILRKCRVEKFLWAWCTLVDLIMDCRCAAYYFCKLNYCIFFYYAIVLLFGFASSSILRALQLVMGRSYSRILQTSLRTIGLGWDHHWLVRESSILMVIYFKKVKYIHLFFHWSVLISIYGNIIEDHIAICSCRESISAMSFRFDPYVLVFSEPSMSNLLQALWKCLNPIFKSSLIGS